MCTGDSRFLRHVGSYIHYTMYDRKRTVIISKMAPRKLKKKKLCPDSNSVYCVGLRRLSRNLDCHRRKVSHIKCVCVIGFCTDFR
jgi:hypothetical protein